MAQAPSNPKIEELRFRLKSDPKNRIFYPLAEELRKVSQFVEAEQVLRTGLTHHPTYLSAWVSLGRVLRDQRKDADAAEALVKAMQLDPGNVVAARLLADAYLALGQKVDAIKKYKLVQALMPSDEGVEEIIARLDGELNPPLPQHVFESLPEARPEPEPPAEHVEAQHEQAPEPHEPEAPSARPEPVVPQEETPFVDASRSPEPEPEQLPPDEAKAPEPQAVPFVGETASLDSPDAIDESPFAGDDDQILAAAEQTFAHEEEPAVVAGEPPVTAVAFEESAAGGEHPGTETEPSPLAIEATPPHDEAAPPHEIDAGQAGDDVFPGTIETPFAMDEPPVPVASPAENLAETMTMADLYARQGLTDSAREIYDHILQRQPENTVVRAKLDALHQEADQEPPPEAAAGSGFDDRSPKVVKLETWLAKVGRRGAGGV